LNIERVSLRRTPEIIKSLVQDFDDTKFNFKKVKKEEILLETEIMNVPVTFLINDSPLSKYHILICPEINENLPQVLNEKALQISIEIMKSFKDKSFIIGYNSPGAFSSVNHLHVQLVRVEKALYVENIVSLFVQ
jgi:hypothetical protein